MCCACSGKESICFFVLADICLSLPFVFLLPLLLRVVLSAVLLFFPCPLDFDIMCQNYITNAIKASLLKFFKCRLLYLLSSLPCFFFQFLSIMFLTVVLIKFLES